MRISFWLAHAHLLFACAYASFLVLLMLILVFFARADFIIALVSLYGAYNELEAFPRDRIRGLYQVGDISWGH